MSLSFGPFPVGATLTLGDHRFTRDEIVSFATAFDPQPFHLSEEAAAQTHFGRLPASGWHTAAAWMRCMVRTMAHLTEHYRDTDTPMPPLGPSPGFETMAWKKPVFVDDVITYHATLTELRPTSRPGIALLSMDNVGVNQHGETVLSFTGRVFVHTPAPSPPGDHSG